MPEGYRIEAMEVRCSHLHLEYVHVEEPQSILKDTLELQVPVRGEEAAYTTRFADGQHIVTLWLPRERTPKLGYDPCLSLPRANLIKRSA
jgi:hypothetical protein